MKVSELTLPIIKQYLRIDGNDDDILLTMFKDASIKFCTSYMGCTENDLEKYPDVSVVVLSLISDSYEVRQFTTSTVTTNPIMMNVLDLHCGNFLGDVTQTDNTPTVPEEPIKTYDIVWGLGKPGAIGANRGYLEYSTINGFGKLHLDISVPTVGNGSTLCALPSDAPMPNRLLEVSVNDRAGSIYIQPKSHAIQCWGIDSNKRYIIDITGFWEFAK